MTKIGRYDIVEELGQGAMGVVYKASDPTIGRLVAIKVLSLSPSKEKGVPGSREIFLREVRAAGRLSHPGIVTIHDAVDDSESGSSYIVMEFVPGRTLESALLSELALGTEQILDIIRQVAEALDYAHRQQVIHRDLKPANILMTEEGRVKITDFGIAKIMAHEAAKRTLAVMGTPSYMSPEQVTGGEVDARTDLFSLGIISYQLLTGQKPFAGDTAAVMFKIAYEDPVAPTRVNPKLNSGHDYVVLRSLVKDRNKRFASAHDLLDNLDDVQHGRPPRSLAEFPVDQLRTGERTVVIREPLVGPPGTTIIAPRKKSIWAITAGGAGVLLLTSFFGFRIWSSHHSKESSPPSKVALINPAPSPALSTPPASSSAGTPSPPPPASVSRQPGTTESVNEKPAGTEKLSKPKPHLSPRVVKSHTTPAAKGGTGTAAASAPSSAPASKTTPTSTGSSIRSVQLVCHHQLKQGTLIVSSGGRTLYQWALKGTKKGGFLGIKSAYSGILSRPIKIPAGVQELSIHVVSPDGSVDLSRSVSAIPPRDALPTLQVQVSDDQLTLSWRAASHHTQ